MLKLTSGATIVLVLVLGVSPHLLAQSKTSSNDRLKTIFDYKQELNLSDRQEEDIKAIIQALGKEIQASRAKLQNIETDVGELNKTDSDLEQIRKKLREAAELQIGMRIADIAATRKINKTMSAEQLKRWREIQSAAARSSQ
jgi:hypothetical protein